MPGTARVPYHDNTTVPATGKSLAIRTHSERLNRPLMRCSHPHALPALHIPPAQHPVAPSTDQQVSQLHPGYSKHETGMPRQGPHALPAVRIPHQQLFAASAPASTGQPRSIGAPCHARDHATMSLQPLEQRAVGGIPQAHAAIIVTAGQPRAVRTPGHATDLGRVRTTDPAAAAYVDLPPPHST